MDEIVNDFLVESNENLDRLDQELVKLESEPSSTELLASVFRTIHTIKGSCGFLGFARLEKLAHAGENLLSRLRDGKLTLSAEITSGLLAMVDAVRHMLAAIQASGQDGEEDYAPLIEVLARLQGEPVAEPPAAPSRSSPDALPSPQSADAGGSTPTRELASKSSPVPSPHKPRRKPRAEKPMDPLKAVLVEGNSGGRRTTPLRQSRRQSCPAKLRLQRCKSRLIPKRRRRHRPQSTHEIPTQQRKPYG
jgi:chemotaxis protein histidine kinase CheA